MRTITNPQHDDLIVVGRGKDGILLLSVAAAVIYVAFGGITAPLIPLFAVGVFLAFTLSQAGMVTSVEVSLNGAEPWQPAQLAAPVSPHAWQAWNSSSAFASWFWKYKKGLNLVGEGDAAKVSDEARRQLLTERERICVETSRRSSTSSRL